MKIQLFLVRYRLPVYCTVGVSVVRECLRMGENSSQDSDKIKIKIKMSTVLACIYNAGIFLCTSLRALIYTFLEKPAVISLHKSKSISKMPVDNWVCFPRAFFFWFWILRVLFYIRLRCCGLTSYFSELTDRQFLGAK